ncbi:MAG TPA: bifunctional oligoribonuclease/PAP phosphatase NrnA [Candidatus Krumholzibacteria bacterium]|nr:bifunctional oligoribonuclease/PAP phosphatase NrnA [Candidatus Krumholzibacteria bacterium]
MWNSLRQFIDRHDSFVISAHINPDGDAIGSELGLARFLRQRGKRVVVMNSTDTPDVLRFLDPDDEIFVYGEPETRALLEGIDAAIIVDVNNWEHLGNIGRPLQAMSIPRACIDHHQGDEAGFAETTVRDTSAAAVGVLIYELIREMGGVVTPEIAQALYAAIITDTGTFRFSNTDARVLRVAADLTEAGASAFEMHRLVFGSKSWGAGRLLGPVLSTLESVAGGRLAIMHATLEMVNNAGANYDDTDGFVDLIRAIRGVELVMFFKETGEGDIKVSLRSNGNVDANAIARRFGGGGHTMASGMRLAGPMQNAIDEVIRTCSRLDDFALRQ